MSDENALTVNIMPDEPNSGVFDHLVQTQLADDSTNIVDTRHLTNAALADLPQQPLSEPDPNLAPVFEEFKVQKDSSRALMSLVLFGLGGVLLAAGLYYTLGDYNVQPNANTPIRVQARHDSSPVSQPKQYMDYRVNPYWSLPNTLPAHASTWKPATPLEQVSWQAGMTHKYFFQKMQTAQNIRKAQRSGTEALLRAGMVSGKVWLNMEIFFGLAEQGVEVKTEEIETLMASIPEDVLVRFLKRFKQAATEGEHFVLRQMMKVAPAPVRFEILAVLQAHILEPLSPLYIVAAQYDPDLPVSSQAQLWTVQIKNHEELKKVVEGKKDFTIPKSSVEAQIQNQLKELDATFKEIRTYPSTSAEQKVESLK